MLGMDPPQMAYEPTSTSVSTIDDSGKPTKPTKAEDWSEDKYPSYLESSADSVTSSTALDRQQWRYKLIALISVLLMSAGEHFVSNSLSSLKSTLKKELDITNTHYGILSGTVSLINTVVPFFVGVIMDTFGPGWGALVACSAIVVGNFLTVMGTYAQSFALLVIGRVVFALGSSSIVLAQETILTGWFRGKGLALSIGLQIMTSKLFGWLASATVVDIAEGTGFYGNAFWVGEGIALFSLVMVAMYGLVMFRLRRSQGSVVTGHRSGALALAFSGQSAREGDRSKRPRATWRQLYTMVYFPDIYWYLPLNEMVMGAVWTPFLGIAAEYVMKRWHEKTSVAAWKSSISLAVPIVGSPVIGLFIDRFGARGPTTIASAVLLLVAVVLLGWTHVSPEAGLTLFSLSLTIGPVALISAVALYLPLNMVGTGIGLLKCGLNFGIIIVDVLVGRLQDFDNDSYDRVMVMMLILACAAVVTSTLFMISDHYWERGIQDAPYARRNVLVEERRPKEQAVIQAAADRARPPTYRYMYFGIFLALFIVSWVLYGVFLMVA
ncbi:hypothetical protein IWQ60_008105 [Tieghemiomyces parasiticus]|uniref:Lysosomal dipeptide transporter MFSD1 n=1 Tax=Tieghemiomyces parasiticus TaxID=78921 RepID=A0A9W7ZXZ5_9FUNG|nr:hypothetical protein IWQ60_008105 [Tieghemiomyces parasiticus]